MPLQGDLSVERMCQLVQVSRAGFYRYLRTGWPTDEEIDLRSAVQEIVLGHRWQYGYPNQLWIADITYIRLYCEFVYLAVVLDGFSRKVVGWSLGRTLQAKLPLRALEELIDEQSLDG